MYAFAGARDNPEMESFHSRFKNENRSLLVKTRDLVELESIVLKWMSYYSSERLHSALGNQAPMAYVRAFQALAADGITETGGPEAPPTSVP